MEPPRHLSHAFPQLFMTRTADRKFALVIVRPGSLSDLLAASHPASTAKPPAPVSGSRNRGTYPHDDKAGNEKMPQGFPGKDGSGRILSKGITHRIRPADEHGD